MPITKKSPLPSRLACTILLILMAGCATHTPMQNVGAVVVAPTIQMQPVPAIVQTTEPKPPGYFQQSLVDYFNASQ